MMVLSMSNIAQRLALARERLAAVGFVLPEPFDFDLEAATQRTNKSLWNDNTLWTVMGIKHLIEVEQPISVRGVYYRAFSAKLYQQGDIDKVGSRVLKMRRAGLIPFEWISDSTRRRIQPTTFQDVAEYAVWVRSIYRKHLWQDQPNHVEIFSEKETMTGVIAPVIQHYDVALTPLRGNNSETWVYDIAERWREIDKPIHAYYLGDHDPNGLDIERDFRRRLEGYLEGRPYEWQRLAVTHDDFQDPRYQQYHFDVEYFKAANRKLTGYWLSYKNTHGVQAMELDALPTNEIRQRVARAISNHIDVSAWDGLSAIEAQEKQWILEKLRLE
jgi:hypothetical protein